MRVFLNINDAAGNGTISPVEAEDILYADLKAKAETNALVPGQFYCITNHRIRHDIRVDTRPWDEVNQKWLPVWCYGPVEPLIVQAITKSQIGPNAYSTVYKNDIIRYALVSPYGNGGDMGEILERWEPERDIHTYHDWRHCKVRRYESAAGNQCFTEYRPPNNDYSGTFAYQDATMLQVGNQAGHIFLAQCNTKTEDVDPANPFSGQLIYQYPTTIFYGTESWKIEIGAGGDEFTFCGSALNSKFGVCTHGLFEMPIENIIGNNNNAFNFIYSAAVKAKAEVDYPGAGLWNLLFTPGVNPFCVYQVWIAAGQAAFFTFDAIPEVYGLGQFVMYCAIEDNRPFQPGIYQHPDAPFTIKPVVPDQVGLALDTTKYVEAVINGVTYKLALVN